MHNNNIKWKNKYWAFQTPREWEKERDRGRETFGASILAGRVRPRVAWARVWAISLPLRELKGETAKETRSAVEDRSFAKTKDEEEREEEAMSEDANDTTMAAIFVWGGLYLFIVNPQSDRVEREGGAEDDGGACVNITS